MTVAVAIALATSLALTPLAKRLAWRFEAVSHPDGQRKMQDRPTPMWGGGSVYLAFLLSVTVAYMLAAGSEKAPPLPGALALTAGMLCVLGCYDDLFDMSARWKLLWQIVSTLPVVLAGGCIEHLVVFGYPVHLGLAGIAFTVGWLVLGINALNLLDGMDGLASTVGIGISAAVAVIAAWQGDPAVMLLALTLAAALIGFLFYNLPPARIYLGDCGSMIIGVTLALLVLRVSMVGQTTTASFTIAAALLFVPLLDTALAIVRRTLQGKGLMTADRGHIHHRLLDRGFGIWQVLALLGGLCLATGGIAWLVALSCRELWAWAMLGGLMVLLVNRQLIGHVEWKLASRLFQRTAFRLARRLRPSERSVRLRTIVPPPLPEEPAGQEIVPVTPFPESADAGDEDRRAAA